MQTGYFFCGDILGFKQIVTSLAAKELDNQITFWLDLVAKLKNKYKITKCHIFSDSIFAVVDDYNELQNLINFCRELLHEGLNQSLPLRGAISYGEYKWGDFIHGKAVLRSHKLEQSQDWIGILLDNNINFTTEDYQQLNLVVYPVPMKNELIRNFTTISWEVPKFEALAAKLTSLGLGGSPGQGIELDWSWGNKIGNTIAYGIYLHALKETRADPSKFHGHHPMHFIDTTLRK